jgi:hypothetical protein
MAVGFLTPFPGVNPHSSLEGAYHSLAELIWAKAEMEFRGDATGLKHARNTFQILRESTLATVKRKFPTGRSTEWQLYRSEVDLWAGFGKCRSIQHLQNSRTCLQGYASDL